MKSKISQNYPLQLIFSVKHYMQFTTEVKVMTIIQEYYNNGVNTEWTRMDRHPLEFEITKRNLDEFIPSKSKIADIGGGPGRYSFYLASQGYNVTLIDLAEKNIEFAKEKGKEIGIKLKNYIHANILEIDFIPANSFDSVLCMGPLYHLINKEDRIKAIDQCLRILKPNGILVITFVTTFAQSISLLKRSPEKISEWIPVLNKTISTGINVDDFDTGFTEAYFFHPLEIELFMQQFSLQMLKISGAEGLGCQSEEILKLLPKEKLKEWIDFFYLHGSDPSILGANQHIIYIGKNIS
jgi:2-polyprenyl-3-methyl-5-hydroxy-6-metoxy-1,4-benzoquinol methylase